MRTTASQTSFGTEKTHDSVWQIALLSWFFVNICCQKSIWLRCFESWLMLKCSVLVVFNSVDMNERNWQPFSPNSFSKINACAHNFSKSILMAFIIGILLFVLNCFFTIPCMWKHLQCCHRFTATACQLSCVPWHQRHQVIWWQAHQKMVFSFFFNTRGMVFWSRDW